MRVTECGVKKKKVAGRFRWQKVGHRCTSLRLILLFDLSLSPQVLIHYYPVSSGVQGALWCVCLPQSVHFTVCHSYFENKLVHIYKSLIVCSSLCLLYPIHLCFFLFIFCPISFPSSLLILTTYPEISLMAWQVLNNTAAQTDYCPLLL